MATSLHTARERKATFDQYVAVAKLPEADRLKRTIDGWWTEIETFTETRVTNARTEAANVTIKNIKRTGRGYRSHANYQSRIMLLQRRLERGVNTRIASRFEEPGCCRRPQKRSNLHSES